jgi:hypothetical protein
LGRDKLKHNSKHNTRICPVLPDLGPTSTYSSRITWVKRKQSSSEIKQENPSNRRRKNSLEAYSLFLEKGEPTIPDIQLKHEIIEKNRKVTPQYIKLL